jgi:predicted metal-dependent peptidase
MGMPTLTPTADIATVRRFKQIRLRVMRSKQFMSLTPVMMYGKITVSDDLDTAMTDGCNEWYGTQFIKDHPDKQVAFAAVHEPMHKAGRHLTTYVRLSAIDAKLANKAMDYWGNSRIKAADPNGEIVEFPRRPDGTVWICYNPEFDGWSIKRIFYHLLEQKQKKKEGGGDTDGNTGGDPGDSGDSGDDDGGFDDHDWEGAAARTAEEESTLEGDMKEATRRGEYIARRAGAGSAAAALGLKELLTPKIVWRKQMEIFMTSTCRKRQHSTRRKPNRRFLHMDIIMATLEGKGIREVVFARDSSGSMQHGTRLNRATSEALSLAKTLAIEKIHFIDWDGEVAGNEHTTYSSASLSNAPELKKARGGGGTDPSCVSRYLIENRIRPQCVVIFTDGEINSWGAWTVPVLWVITNNKPITAPVGQTIQVED